MIFRKCFQLLRWSVNEKFVAFFAQTYSPKCFIHSDTHKLSELPPKLTTMKLSENQLNFVLQPPVVKLSEIFTKYGYEIRIAGGAVRDLLMGIFPKDFDFATTAKPTEMKEMFENENIRMINMGGEKHGTITALIDDQCLECTTLRIDKSTDGRHAEVEFIKNWDLDAGRRDLTINSLYLGLDGTVYDYYDGIKHIENKVIAFVGDPERRIREDYLRILRYFRFYGRLADGPDNHCPHTLEVIAKNCDGLAKISGERIWIEVKKIVTGRFGGELVVKMVECGLSPHIGLSPDFDCDAMIKMYRRIPDPSLLSAATLLASGFISESDVLDFLKRVKCSNKERDILLFIEKEKNNLNFLSPKTVKDLLVDMIYLGKKKKSDVLFVATELVRFAGRDDLLPYVNSDIPHFPIKGGMLMDKVKRRQDIGKHLHRLLVLWKESDYMLTADELLEKVCDN